MKIREIVEEGRVIDFPKTASVGKQGDVAHKKGNVTPLPKRTANPNVSLTKDEEGRTVARGKTMADVYEEEDVSEDWNKVNQRDKTDGMSRKAVKAYRREHPGSKLQTAVTTKPSKLKPGSKAAKRRKSFCARMSGNKGPMKDEKGRPTPKAKALRRWNCNESSDVCQVCGQTPCNCTHLYENANPKVDLTPNYPNYSTLVGEFMGVKGERYVFKIVDAVVKPGVSETERIAKAVETGKPIGIQISRVKNRNVIGEN